MEKLKDEIIQRITDDPEIFAAVAKEMNVKPYSLAIIARRNGNSINRYSVVKLIASMLGKNPEELVSENIMGQQR